MMANSIRLSFTNDMADNYNTILVFSKATIQNNSRASIISVQLYKGLKRKRIVEHFDREEDRRIDWDWGNLLLYFKRFLKEMWRSNLPPECRLSLSSSVTLTRIESSPIDFMSSTVMYRYCCWSLSIGSSPVMNA